MQSRGMLTKWNDDRGFGFIKDSEAEMIFLHITAVKMMPRRPKEGDILLYDIIIDTSGKKKAGCATIEGLQRVKLPNKNTSKNVASSNLRSTCMLLVVVLAVLFFYFKTARPVLDKNELSEPVSLGRFQEADVKEAVSKFSCQGKTHCSEMVSCEEATFYLKNCPGQKTDGDEDGVPCESQWCN